MKYALLFALALIASPASATIVYSMTADCAPPCLDVKGALFLPDSYIPGSTVELSGPPFAVFPYEASFTINLADPFQDVKYGFSDGAQRLALAGAFFQLPELSGIGRVMLDTPAPYWIRTTPSGSFDIFDPGKNRQFHGEHTTWTRNDVVTARYVNDVDEPSLLILAALIALAFSLRRRRDNG